jgi:hypothetical protein
VSLGLAGDRVTAVANRYILRFSNFFLWFSEEHFLFYCTIPGCDGGNQTRNIAVYTDMYIFVKDLWAQLQHTARDLHGIKN